MPQALCGKMAIAVSVIIVRHNSIQRKTDYLFLFFFGTPSVEIAFPYVSLARIGSHTCSYASHRILLTGLDQYGSRPGGCNGNWRHVGEEGHMHKKGAGGNWEAVNSIHYNLTLQVPYFFLAEVG